MLCPWRSARLGWAVTALALLAGVPPFLCLPPWNDVTLHDLAARTILRGGVHYRDVFDTNLPGIDWTMAAIRSIFGWSYEALRAWDLLIVAATTTILAGIVKRAGGTNAAIAWFAAAAALFYPFTSEFNHCQRDVWMLLPAAAAVRLRLTHLDSGRLKASLLEGFVWGIAVWFKPHVLIPAAAVWFASQRFLPGGRLRDLGGVLLGGILAGALGVLWLVQTGAWPYFVDVFTNWNPEYVAEGVWQTIPFKAAFLVRCFLPWGFVHLAAIPAALLGLRQRESPARALLAALYLGWVVQVVMLQKPFDYVQVPAMLLAFAVLASRGWSVGFPFLLWFLTIGLPVDRLAVWPRCWSEGSSPELRDRLGHFTHTHWGTNWENLRDVERYLRTVEPPLRDRELTCWHDSTHPLYLTLDVEPSTRYMHFGTVFPLRSKVDEIRAEVIRSPQQYVVSDLLRATRDGNKAYDPAWFPAPDRFPWNQPVVFRSGRYAVHRITTTPRPEEIDIPDWSEVK